MFGSGPQRRHRRPPLRFMVIVGEMCVFVGLADLVTEVLGHAASVEGTLAVVSLLVLGAAWLLWGWSSGGR